MQKKTIDSLAYQFGLIGFSRFSNILRLTPYVLSIHPRYTFRLLIVVVSSILSIPLRLLESLIYGRRIRQTVVGKTPIFIIGHWRSGTTHLHNLMTQDCQFGYLSMYQSMVPDCSLIGRGWLKLLLNKIIPAKRPMDNMIWPMDAPQEEEVALAKMMPVSFYTQFLFPKQARNFLYKYVLMEGDWDGRRMAELKSNYKKLLKIATLHSSGRQLILKNPVNTGRIKLLLEMFPDAKFVYIHRSPYDVFKSVQNLYKTLSMITTLQSIDTVWADETILILYKAIMQRYLEDRDLIPEENLVEIRFEDLERHPLRELKRIYECLDLPGYGRAKPYFEDYLQSQSCYQKNRLHLCADLQFQIEDRWAFAFSEFGYVIENRQPLARR